MNPQQVGRAGMMFRSLIATLLTIGLAGTLAGCGKSDVDKAFESDANGYLCLKCKAKFYTDRTVFPRQCPECKNTGFEQVVGYVCAADKQVVIGTRGRRSMACDRCGAIATGMSIPNSKELKSWGAIHKTEAEVTGK